jgi:hypothetical protein
MFPFGLTPEVLVISSYLRTVLTPWRYSSCRTLTASHTLCEVSWQKIFTGWGRQPHAQPSTLRTRVSLLVWHLPRNLSGTGDPTSSYAAAGIALEFIGAHKPPHPATECFRQCGDPSRGNFFISTTETIYCGITRWEANVQVHHFVRTCFYEIPYFSVFCARP